MRTAGTIRLALLGASGARELYGGAVARLQRGAFGVIVDPEESVARSAADVLGAARVHRSFDEALVVSGSAFDAVVVRAASAERPSLVEQAARAGKPVLVQAPLGSSATEVRRLAKAFRERGVPGMVAGTLRFLPAYRTLLNRLDEEKLGTPGLLRVHRWCAGGTTADPSGEVLERITSEVDLAIRIFEAKPLVVFALGSNPRSGASDTGVLPPYLQLHLGFPQAAMAVFDFATTLPAGKGYDSLHIIGSRGAAYADDHHNTHLLFAGGDPRARIAEPGRVHVLSELQEFVDALLEERPPAVPLEAGSATQEVLDAVVRSLAEGQAVEMMDGDR